MTDSAATLAQPSLAQQLRKRADRHDADSCAGVHRYMNYDDNDAALDRSAAEALDRQTKQIEDLSRYATQCGEAHAAATDQVDTLSKQTLTREQIEAGARELFRIGNERIGPRRWEDVGHYYIAEAEACLTAALRLRPS